MYSKKYYQENKERISKRVKLAHQNMTDEQREKLAAYQREWKKKNKDPEYRAKIETKKNRTDEERRLLHNECQRRYYEKHKEEINEKYQLKHPNKEKVVRIKRVKVIKEVKGIKVVYKKKPIVDKQDFYKEIVLSKAQDKLTPTAERYLIRVGDVSYRKNAGTIDNKKDIKQHAYMKLFSNWRTFDENKYDNPFAYYTEVFKRAMAEMWGFQHNTRRLNGNPNIVKLVFVESVDW